MLTRRFFLLAGLGALAASAAAARGAAPGLMLAEVYRPGMSLADYWVSEKYDGVRGYWDGKRLWTQREEQAMEWIEPARLAVPFGGCGPAVPSLAAISMTGPTGRASESARWRP